MYLCCRYTAQYMTLISITLIEPINLPSKRVTVSPKLRETGHIPASLERHIPVMEVLVTLQETTV